MSDFRFGSNDYHLNIDWKHQEPDLVGWDGVDWNRVEWVKIDDVRYVKERTCHWKAEKDGEWRLHLTGDCGYYINIDRETFGEEKFCPRCGGCIEVVD